MDRPVPTPRPVASPFPPIHFTPANRWTRIDGQDYAVITEAESMEPFFMSLVSAADHWFFCASSGALTAGRRSPDSALFPYLTVDKILDNWNTTGPWTALVCEGVMWNPFRPSIALLTPARRRLLKSVTGDELRFEETHTTLGLRFSYRWRLSENFGFVRFAKLENVGDRPRGLKLVDGLDSLMPPGVNSRFHLHFSCLTDAYKLSELEAGGRLFIHRLAAGITDKPVPLENLLATTVWTAGLGEGPVFLSRPDAESFLRRLGTKPVDRVRGQRGAMFMAREMTLEAGKSAEWLMVADIGQSQADTSRLLQDLSDPAALEAALLEDLARGREKLVDLVAAADGIQRTGDRDSDLHHYHNVVCNIMRGGVPAEGYQVRRSSFIHYLTCNNTEVAKRQAAWLAELPDAIERADLLQLASATGDADLRRLSEEYLPFTLSRRHGDPSRPWNFFDIRLKDEAGSPILHYEGNWRDIFQNWEALAWSHPGFLPAFIRKFLNASTIDGYNPYRITSEGVDWEAPDEHDPWSSIGYWGDHQIVYLLKLLELQAEVDPGEITLQLDARTFVHAAVPYRLKGWEATLADPRHTVDFDLQAHRRAMQERDRLGGDGLLRRDADGRLCHATLLEKLLIPAAAKLSNLVPGGGIWLNTQRPEWNDANNALAGCGLSVVTAAHLHRYLAFLGRKVRAAGQARVSMSRPLADWISTLADLFEDPRWQAGDPRPGDRFELVSGVGRAGEAYRNQVAAESPGDPGQVETGEVIRFIDRALEALSRTLHANRRKDGLYESYNTLSVDREARTMDVGRLPLMLEGQVAMLNSGLLPTKEALRLLEALPTSALYCPRHRSYLLYPDRELPRFLETNRISRRQLEEVPILVKMIARSDERLVIADPLGGYRFHPSLENAYSLASCLETLGRDPALAADLDRDRDRIHRLYEDVFRHQSFTGRSGSMFGYEGLGCIYWHMVSKLMLAAQETALSAAEADEETRSRLVRAYYGIQAGLGFRKTAREYGAFPAEPYSHSTSFSGARQPGLTGQVKEGILCRLGELGVRFRSGRLTFRPRLLRSAEFDGDDADTHDRLFFTICRIPVHYHRRPDRDDALARVTQVDGTESSFEGAMLDAAMTREVVLQTGRVSAIDVEIPSCWLVT
ncbi:hypothetical protein Hsar01_03144 [Haloferula sargassicola]|uniref:Cellobiose phosphorylase n=2 Tax=Haloferula sargassicola TaxID=490096 RepID=A0ABP9URD6_9BACT